MLKMLIFLLFGIGFGYFIQRGGICFSHGLAEIFLGKGKRIMRIFLVIFTITSIGFLASGFFYPELGLKPVGQIRGFGFFNILSGMIFGAGIMLCGGCILGTLRQIGEGNLFFIAVLLSFIPGMFLVTKVINPVLEKGYRVEKFLLPDIFQVNQMVLTVVLVIMSVFLFFSPILAVRKKRIKKRDG